VGPAAATCRQFYPQPADAAALPFDTDLAHELYRQTLGPVADLLRGRQLLIAAMDAFTTLPLHVLVTAPPAAGGSLSERMQSARWLSQRQPITTLASVASLKTQRVQARGPRAPKPYLAFANPLLLGENGDDRRAFDRQSCPPVKASSSQRLLTKSRSARMLAGGGADIEALRRGSPLPESTDEVCAVARALNAPVSDVYLGARATVSAVKQLGRRNALTDYRVVHFATHGLMVGGASAVEQALTEPAILLTPPAPDTAPAALADDNGLLGSSDIAALNLNADWVILSACNTAAGSGTEVEALAGLSRAFLYAGARALLVSHWEVDSIAAVKITTAAFAEISRNPQTPRAKALQVAMSALIASAEPHEAHPAYWAPFVVVGDGGSIGR
jgi:CHAT domain-containing protein